MKYSYLWEKNVHLKTPTVAVSRGVSLLESQSKAVFMLCTNMK